MLSSPKGYAGLGEYEPGSNIGGILTVLVVEVDYLPNAGLHHHLGALIAREVCRVERAAV